MKRTLKTIATLAALAWLLPSTTASAQDAAVTAAIEELERMVEGSYWLGDSTVAILRQAFGPRTLAELDWLADRLAAMAADTTVSEPVRLHAMFALAGAADLDRSRRGKPYARAFDLLVQLHEGGYDRALSTIFRLDPERGPAYVQDVFERSERPPLCRWSYDSGRYEPPQCVRGYHTFHRVTWCRAGDMLYRDTVSQAWDRTPGGWRGGAAGYPPPVPDGLPEHVEDWYRRCQR
ncbi:MAG: hypothetical protein OXG58_10025 [Gemmatimonadetes bacterium]|nr:hypothetical protein [Gemmatimonadota bacterium]MCY3942996.1 hypothetical protein [Gemmatimonadota bacterium]